LRIDHQKVLPVTAAGFVVIALLRVRDHGPGVPGHLLSDIFVPFHRVQSNPVVTAPGTDFFAHNGSESNSQGAGLGLAIAERVVRMHDGSIRASNAPD
jgi:signal transduction histidine kinase